MEKEKFLIIWFEPTYYEAHSLETFHSIQDENRGFTKEVLMKVRAMNPEELERFEDFIIYRIS